MQTSSPSTNIFRGSTRSIMWWSFWRASMYGSGLRNDSKGPTNERSSWRNRRAPAQSPPPRAFWYPRTTSFAPAIGSLLLGGRGERILPAGHDRPARDAEPEEAAHSGDVDPGQDDLSAGASDLRRGRIEISDKDVVHAARNLLRRY